jgi:hypothetical protein
LGTLHHSIKYYLLRCLGVLHRLCARMDSSLSRQKLCSVRRASLLVPFCHHHSHLLYFVIRLPGAVKRTIVIQIVLLVALCIFSFFIAWATSHVCISVFPVHVSTRISRPASSDVCLQRDPCHLYLTVGTDLARELIVHVHSSHKYGKLMVAMSRQSHPDAKSPFFSPPVNFSFLHSSYLSLLPV